MSEETTFPFSQDWEFLVSETNKNISRWHNYLDMMEGEYANKKGVTPYEVVYQKNRFRIIRYISDAPKRFKTPLLFVYALINRYYILDLTEDKSFVRFLLDKGFDVYMVDWGVPSKVEGKNSMGDYLDRYLDRGIDKVLELTGESELSVCGYCLGAMMSLLYTASYPEKVKNLILLTPPVDFDDDGVLTKMTQPKYFDVDRIVNHFGNIIPSEFIQTGFDFKNALGNMMTPISNWNIFWNKKALKDFFPMHHWVNDNVPIGAEFWREYIKKFYMENSFMKNNVSINGRKLDFKKITCPVLAIAADRDDIVTLKCAEGSMKIVGSQDKHFMVKKGGHIGVMTGSMAKNEVWPDFFYWLSKRSERLITKEGNLTIIH